MKILKLLAPVVALCLLGACATRKTPDRGSADSGYIEARVGKDFVIKLPSNPTTGYSWRLTEPLPDMLELSDKDYRTPAENRHLVGAGGVEEWRFKAVRRAEATLVFEYVRPWEKDTPPVERRSFTIRIR
jgi:inhibitor of cysteine peptidase